LSLGYQNSGSNQAEFEISSVRLQSRLTSNKEHARLELLEENNSLPHEPPGEQDQHGARSDGRPARIRNREDSQLTARNSERRNHGAAGNLSLVGFGLRVLGLRGFTSSAG